MKKIVLFFLLASLFTSAVYAQQWVGFTKSEPAAPELNLLSSNPKTVSFEVTIPGIYSMDTVVNGTTFTRLYLSGGNPVNVLGYPELPTLQYNIAIPACSRVEISYSVKSQRAMNPCLIFPVPNAVPETNSEGVVKYTQVFAFDSTAYAQSRLINPVVWESSTGALRAQHYVEVTLQPFEYFPISQELSIMDKVEITLIFDNPTSDIRQNVGIFNRVATNTFINYEDDGMSASFNDKAFEKEGFTPGKVKWITLTDTAQACQIEADYLILCQKWFFNPQNADLQRLAEHRAFYNGFDVAIVNVEHVIDLGFEYEGNSYDPDPQLWDKYIKEQKMRTFIRRVYEGAHAQHTEDGKLAYVALVGDNFLDNTQMPTSYDNKIPSMYGPSCPTDYYFSCLTKNEDEEYDPTGDLFIGRISATAPEHLHNVVEKTIHYETEFDPRAWRKSAGYTNRMCPVSGNLLLSFELSDSLVRLILDEVGWNYDIINCWEQPNELTKDSTLNYLNKGVMFMQDFGTGMVSLGEITQNDFKLYLKNDYKTPFIHQYVGDPCAFPVHSNGDCIGEFLTRYSPTAGAIGIVGCVGAGWIDVSDIFIDTLNLHYRDIYSYYLFRKKISHEGELVLAAKLNNAKMPFSISNGVKIPFSGRYMFNLIGDPAVNILAQGYEITHDVTADMCPVEIPCSVQVHNGATLTVLSNCNLNFLQEGKLNIEEGGTLLIEDNVKIVGKYCEEDTIIHVKNGIFILGNNVTFNNLNGKLIIEEGGTLIVEDNAQIFGEFCERDTVIHIKGGKLTLGNNATFNNLKGVFIENNTSVYNNTKQYNLSNAIFNNTPLTHRNTRLNITNCTFNAGSNVITSSSISNIDSCTFIASGFLAAHPYKTMYPMTSSTMVTHCNFTGNNSASSAVELSYSKKLNISNNIITGYATGISLSNSGTWLVGLAGPDTTYFVADVIWNNQISSCGTGIELYNAVSRCCSNHIFENGFGVKLFNNSYTSFENSPQSPQIIQDNDSYEFYADENSFPIDFKYNKIIDEDNLGNSFNDPMFYLDVIISNIRYDVSLNYWGENFDPAEDLYPMRVLKGAPIWAPHKPLSPTLSPAETLYQTGLTYFAEEDYTNAELTFKELIETYPESQFAIGALHELFALQHFTYQDYATLSEYYATFTPADTTLFAVADFLSTRCYVQESFWQPAIDWYENRIENPPSYQDSVFAVIDLGDIHLRMEAETSNNGAKSSAAACHYRLEKIKPRSKQEYETNKADLLATLPQIKKPKTENLYNPLSDKKGSLGQNIPNPANGTTTIAYGINTEGAVEIGIYNAMGQLVKTFPQGMLKEGNYQTKISLSGMPNGIYSYVLLVNGERADARKMVVNW